jgi:hypothetical protein
MDVRITFMTLSQLLPPNLVVVLQKLPVKTIQLVEMILPSGTTGVVITFLELKLLLSVSVPQLTFALPNYS